jgi:hypothetical protein
MLKPACGVALNVFQLIGVIAAAVVLACVRQDEKYKKFSTMQ